MLLAAAVIVDNNSLLAEIKVNTQLASGVSIHVARVAVAGRSVLQLATHLFKVSFQIYSNDMYFAANLSIG